ncbi:hypothetical protein [Sporomusa termitida]|uniref:TIGR03986: CRISPR-associated protein n=1 Tax=Sporomusa termitida TaxID=2377 RepID=A0A517DNH6_9FIRM|nr:hypothetical protein [Sporomusa termitida]QDR78909.1 TIGR03986: CRISPR-associated protein [Sporomusa termitida]
MAENRRGSRAGKADKLLPYDFVPFAETAYYPYQKPGTENRPDGRGGDLPGHDCRQNDKLSGFIEYTLTPYSDLALEIRQRLGGGYFMSGSQIRGRVRANLEILSASYPEFIDTTPLLYRDLTGKHSKDYRERINPDSEQRGIEYAVQAGFLVKEDDAFYIIPAPKIGEKYFLSIKEHRLLQMGMAQPGKCFRSLYCWEPEMLERFRQLQEQIDAFTKTIKMLRARLKSALQPIEGKIADKFRSNYGFQQRLKNILYDIRAKKNYSLPDELAGFKRKLLAELRPVGGQGNVEEFFQKLVDRWGLKAELYISYQQLRKNRDFRPYQQKVFLQKDENQGIIKISYQTGPEPAYLFNSTNASSKRSHYLVLAPGNSGSLPESYKVPAHVIAAYRRNLDKFRQTDKNTSVKEFYNIFEKYDEVCRQNNALAGLIVFFQQEQGEVRHVGRTPYFKIPYRHQLTTLLGRREPEKVDYAGALFGFVAEKTAAEPAERQAQAGLITAYKSRLRFTPVDIEPGDTQTPDLHKPPLQPFLLPTPRASACAMYLEQPAGGDLQTYEQLERPRLNGYKYYHIFPPTLKKGKPENWLNPGMLSNKPIIQRDSVKLLRGKIYFHNLTQAELGLLLLSLEPKQLLKTRQYGPQAEQYRCELEQAYDLIGGAKPYGYGKVKIEVRKLELEKSGCDFASLVLDTEEIIAAGTWGEYIDTFIAGMGGSKYFDTVHFRQYLQSKLELPDDNELITWDQLPTKIAEEKSSQVGYPKHWRLQRIGKKH